TQEVLDPLACLGWHRGQFLSRLQRRDHVQLASPGNLSRAREVDRAELDGRPDQRANNGAGVVGVEQEPEPGKQIAYLGSVEECACSSDSKRDPPLLERSCDDPRFVAGGAYEDGRLAWCCS